MQLEQLRVEVWKKAKGNEKITKGNHHYEDISKAIFNETGYRLSRDTVRNFLEGRHAPQPKVLDIYATYVLGGTSEEPKTSQDLEEALRQKPVLERIGDVLKEGRKGFWVILVFLALIIALVGVVLYRQQPDIDPLFLQIVSEKSAVSAPNQDSLDQFLPEKALVKSILSTFQFDERKVITLEEGLRMMEWLGIRRMTHYTGGAENYLSGYLGTGCMLTIWIGTYGKRDTYGLRCNCNEINNDEFKPYYLEIPRPKETEEWYYQFTDPTLKNLSADNWNLLDPVDTIIFNAYNKKGQSYLTLPTLLGDSWLVTLAAEPVITNILAHPLTCGNCCKIEVKITDFNPFQPYQQAGFFLFYAEELHPSLRYTFASSQNDNHVQAVQRDAKNVNKHLISFREYRQRSLVSKILSSKSGSPYPQVIIDSIVLKLTIRNDEYFFDYKIDNNPFVTVESKEIKFGPPHTIGLASFQGRPDLPAPVLPIADTLEAKFEYVKVNKCD